MSYPRRNNDAYGDVKPQIDHNIIMSSSPLHRALEIISSQVPETTFEFYSDATLGVAFLATAIIAAKR